MDAPIRSFRATSVGHDAAVIELARLLAAAPPADGVLYERTGGGEPPLIGATGAVVDTVLREMARLRLVEVATLPLLDGEAWHPLHPPGGPRQSRAASRRST